MLMKWGLRGVRCKILCKTKKKNNVTYIAKYHLITIRFLSCLMFSLVTTVTVMLPM